MTDQTEPSAVPPSTADKPRASLAAVVRPATEVDLPGIVRVYVAAYAQPPWNERNDPAESERYLRWVMQVPGTSCLVAMEGAPAAPAGESAVRGFILASPRDYSAFVEDWTRTADLPPHGWPAVPGRLGYVWELAVDPAAQRRGIGTALLAAAIRRLQEQGVERVLLRSSERAAAAVALYRHFGFQRLPLRERRDPLAGPWSLTLNEGGRGPWDQGIKGRTRR